MDWHDIGDPRGRELEELAARYALHALHVEDCRNPGQRTKVEEGDRYIFLILKLLDIENPPALSSRSLAIFVGSDFLITVHDHPVPLVTRLRERYSRERTDQVLHFLLDAIVDSWVPAIEKLEDAIEQLQDVVTSSPRPAVLEEIAGTRTTLMHLRRVVGGARQLVFRLRHMSSVIVGPELSPFLRDVHDDLAIHLDTIAGARDRLTGILDIYLSSVANRTTEATRTLTLLGTAALPSLVLTGLFGMTIDYPAWTRQRWMFGVIVGTAIAITGLLLAYLRWHDYLPGGSTARQTRRPASEVSASGHDGSENGRLHDDRTAPPRLRGDVAGAPSAR